MGIITQRKHVTPYVAGCKVRKHGKGYLNTNSRKWISQYGLAYFLYDPPISISPEEEVIYGLCDQGISYITDPSTGILHAQNVVGRNNYPNTADVLMEILNGWASALVPLQGENVKLLEPIKSRRLIYHRGGYLHNYGDYRREYLQLSNIQQCMLPESDDRYLAHIRGDDMCASLHWQHVIGGNQEKDSRHTVRTIGEMVYDAYAPIENWPPEEGLALIGWLPIDEINIVDSEEIDDKSAIDEALAFLVGQTSMPIYVTDH
jgi:hypothetical protein